MILKGNKSCKLNWKMQQSERIKKNSEQHNLYKREKKALCIFSKL